jgi:glycosyltransferase involved in cell wall biosynthesis
MIHYPKVSIVTISYNQCEFLERAIQSVLTQDYQEIEYIVVDPGSTDGSRELIESYKDKIARIIFEPDCGAADGLNKGFAAATGEIYGFLNSDDILYPEAVQQAVSYLEKHSNIDVVSGNAKVIDPQDRVLRSVYSDKFVLKRAAYGAAILIQPSTFFRRLPFENSGGFNVANRSSWDGELFIDMGIQGARFERFDANWSGYRLHSTSITATRKFHDASQQYRRRIFQKIMGRAEEGRDLYIAQFYRLLRHLQNLRDTRERVFKGPVYGRMA